MSRAINIQATEARVTQVCKTNGARISAIETLMSGGTRVVLATMDDADKIRSAFEKKILDTPVVRTRWVRNH